MIDIDHFKVVNDTYGHPIGDQVLKNLAELFHSVFREIDVVGRVGGEEFLVLLPETDSQEAVRVAERLRVLVEKHTCARVSNLEIKIQISIGVSTIQPNQYIAQDPHFLMEQFVKKSDDAMYKAKKLGRNRTCCCE
jgi:diguanylate cyclase (GGDEF)-like protein